MYVVEVVGIVGVDFVVDAIVVVEGVVDEVDVVNFVVEKRGYSCWRRRIRS